MSVNVAHRVLFLLTKLLAGALFSNVPKHFLIDVGHVTHGAVERKRKTATPSGEDGLIPPTKPEDVYVF